MQQSDVPSDKVSHFSVEATLAGRSERSNTPMIAVVILAYNEEIHIERAISSVHSLAIDILVVDSFSTDNTVALAERAGARVLRHAFVNQAQQFQWAIDNGNVSAPWILRLDADEIIEPDLARLLAERVPQLPSNVVGVNLCRKHIFLGRWIRHGGRYPLLMLRLFRRGHGRVENRWMDEHIITWGGTTVTIPGGFADANERDLTYFTAKHNAYATREAIDVLLARYKLGKADQSLTAQSASRQAHVKRWLKHNLYNRLPLWAAPTAYFLFRYLVQLGFLDGREGLVYHVLQGFWYRFLVAAKTLELDRGIKRFATPVERLAELSRLTGYDLSGMAQAGNC